MNSVLKIATVISFCAATVFAGDEKFAPKQTIGDGKNGRASGQWKQQVSHEPIKRVVVICRRMKGGDDTFINLRFEGKGTLDGGKRVYLKDNDKRKYVWEVNQSSNGKPLVLNAYQGEVYIREVYVRR